MIFSQIFRIRPYLRETTDQMPRKLPERLLKRNQEQRERVLFLTKLAIKVLEEKGDPVTLCAVTEMTRSLDSHGKGITAKTLLRNEDAAAYFREHSPAYHARHPKERSRKGPRRTSTSAVISSYCGLRTPDFIQILEEQKAQIAELKQHISQLEEQRKRAYQLRDEALELNARQLAVLTRLQLDHGISE
jgi:hypothetical protein